MARAQQIALENRTLNAATQLNNADISLGTHSFDKPQAALDTSGTERFNAVEVAVRRTTGSLNGPVSYFMATIFGKSSGGVIATARAVYDDRFAGFRVEEQGYPDLIPFTVDVDLYNEMSASGNDQFGWDGGEVVDSGDGVNEVRLYPWKLSGQDFETGSGNFGILEFAEWGSSGVEEQVKTGITASQVEDTLGTSQLMYYDQYGEPTSYSVSGNTGMRSTLEDTLLARVGDVVGFFLHDNVELDGTNATFNNVGMRFARIVDVSLSGNPNDRQIVLQPVAFTGSSVIVRETAPSSQGQVGRFTLTH